MNIFLTGASGTGKSTLALALNQKYPDFLFIPSFVTKVARRIGFDINKPYTFKERLNFQEKLLEPYLFYVEAGAKAPMIFARSPLCMAAYLDCEPAMTRDDWGAVVRYVDDCIDLVEDHCDLLVYCPPLASGVEPRDDRPDLSIHGADYNLRCDNFITNYCNIVWNCNLVMLEAEQSVEERIQIIEDKARMFGLDF